MNILTFLRGKLRWLTLGRRKTRVSSHRYKVTKQVNKYGTSFKVYRRVWPFWKYVESTDEEAVAWRITDEEVIGYREVRRGVEEREEGEVEPEEDRYAGWVDEDEDNNEGN